MCALVRLTNSATTYNVGDMTRKELNENYRKLATAMIEGAVADYRLLEKCGFIQSGRPNLGGLLMNEAECIAWRHRGKEMSYTVRKLKKKKILGSRYAPVYLMRQVKVARTWKRQPVSLLNQLDMNFEECELAVSFFNSKWFFELSHFVGIDPNAAREKLGVYKGFQPPQESLSPVQA